jgi:hypothetical protein
MENTIALKEDRGTVEKFRSWYKEKFIDTGKSSDFEEKLDEKIKREKRIVKIAGTIATIVLIFVPADGPIGELCTAAATPLLVKLVDLKGKIQKGVILNGKRELEAQFIKADGRNEKIDAPKVSITDFKDMKSIIDGLSNSGKTL